LGFYPVKLWKVIRSQGNRENSFCFYSKGLASKETVEDPVFFNIPQIAHISGLIF